MLVLRLSTEVLVLFFCAEALRLSVQRIIIQAGQTTVRFFEFGGCHACTSTVT